jgi:hypothetical protein
MSYFKIICVTRCVVCEVTMKCVSTLGFARVELRSARTLQPVDVCSET